MLPSMSEAITFALLCVAAIRLAAARSALRHTTLAPAAAWGVAGLAMWAAGTLGRAVGVPPALADAWDHLTVSVLLAPPLTVLGARRPTTRVWTVFVLLPMLVILNWPVLARLWAQSWSSPLELTPVATVGFWLVLVMGFGNYLLTIWSGPALLAGAALALQVVALVPQWRPAGFGPIAMRSVAADAFAVSILWAEWIARRRLVPLLNDPSRSAIERLWVEFSECFGLVWSVRIAERLNRTAAQEGWPVRFEPFRIVAAGEDGAPQGGGHDAERPSVAAEEPLVTGAVRAEIEHALRWLLRRFVDPPWLDARLGRGERLQAATEVGLPRVVP